MDDFKIRANPDSFCIDDILDVVEHKYTVDKEYKRYLATEKKEARKKKRK